MEIKLMQELRRHNEVEVEHIFRERNQVADIFTNFIFNFTGTQIIMHFNSFQELPTKAKSLIHMEEIGMPALRIKKISE